MNATPSTLKSSPSALLLLKAGQGCHTQSKLFFSFQGERHFFLRPSVIKISLKRNSTGETRPTNCSLSILSK
jgi:hypothetical protein